MKKISIRTLTVAASGAAIASAVLAGGVGSADAATPNHAASGPHAQSPSDSCQSNYTEGWASVDLIITNNTDQPLTYDPELSGPSTGHWHERPQSTLAPGACEVVNAYAPTDGKVFYFNVVYTMPNGDYVPFGGTANSTNPSSNPYVFSQLPEYHKNNYYWSGTTDPNHLITQMSENGLLHTHFELVVK